ncbi:hypothetical protein KGQ71_01795 [Patescibacteria group bacterium]|nr:hypothetical protein [Patescibacteria group bacterium]
MAGGAGTRLWPISRQKRPKQFQAFVNEETLLQHMVELCKPVVPLNRIYIMATPEFRSVILEQLPELPDGNILYEPARRDNGPAITLGMAQIHQKDPEAIVAILWSDHVINEPKTFADTVRAAFTASAHHPKSLITIGVNPAHPDTGLGYIQMGEEVQKYDGVPVFKVHKFIEKPDLETATKFVSSWQYLWNVGYKIMSTKEYLAIFKAVQPDLKKTVEELEVACHKNDTETIAKLYENFPKLSIEYLFTPFVKDLLVVPGDLGWSDIGSWNILHDILKKRDGEHVITRGEVISIDSNNSLIYAKDRPIAVVGVNNLIVVDEGDTLLVMSRDAAQSIKTVIKALEDNHQELL